MKTVARIITRLQGEEDGLFIGTLMEGGKEHFKPNTVYEIREVLGTLTIVEISRGIGLGPDNGSNGKINEHGRLFHWAEDIGSILGKWGAGIFLTEDEADARFEYFKQHHDENDD